MARVEQHTRKFCLLSRVFLPIIRRGDMAGTPTQLMTVEEYRKLPETDVFVYELHHGELVQVTRPKLRHVRIQGKLVILIGSASKGLGWTGAEVPFRALPEYELRAADVAWVSQERWEAADDDDYLPGAPDLVVEVLSPSNTMDEIAEKEKLCLENGCREFWVVTPKLRQVKVSTPDSITITYREGQQIPLRLFGDGTLPVDEIFKR